MPQMRLTCLTKVTDFRPTVVDRYARKLPLMQVYNGRKRTGSKQTHWDIERLQLLFSERELKFMFAICRRPSVCRLSVVCLSVTFVRPTQTIEIFGNVSTR